jgi:hypothetical protein
MAQQVVVQLVDDLDGSSSDDITTVQFGLDGVQYEIDLSATNADSLRKGLADFVTAARRTGGRLKKGLPSPDGGGGSGEAGQIREWALDNGYELAARGRIAAHVVEAYRQAQQPQPVKTRASAKRGKAVK